MMMMGYAYQKGLLPLSAEAIEQAIEVNGVAIKMNTQAFRLGRLAAADPARLVAMMKGQDETVAPKTLDAMSLDEIIAHRSALLTDYQNAKLADRYRNAGDAGARRRDATAVSATHCRARSRSTMPSCSPTRTSTRWRGSTPTAGSKSSSAISSKATSSSASISRRRCSAAARTRSGRPQKRAFGAWMMPVFRVLAKMKGLRGTAFDIFGYSADRRLERDLIAGYEKDVATVLGLLSPVTLDTAIELLSLPDRIRGYGPVKEKAVQDAKARYAELPPTSQPAAGATADRGGIGLILVYVFTASRKER